MSSKGEGRACHWAVGRGTSVEPQRVTGEENSCIGIGDSCLQHNFSRPIQGSSVPKSVGVKETEPGRLGANSI